MAGNPFPQSKEQLLQAYRTMRTIREFEERLHIDFGRGDIPGFVHLYAGEEAAGTGIMMHLGDGDRIASTHRGHGHCIAKGVDPVAMMKEIYGRKGGSCEGKGGSMHIADLSRGMMGANGILGAGAPLVCGAALAAKFRGDGGVAISFVGDGASNQGTFLESLNLAAVWNLPAIFVVENNGYAESTSRDYAVAVDSFVDRAAGFGLPGVTVDGLEHERPPLRHVQLERDAPFAQQEEVIGGRALLEQHLAGGQPAVRGAADDEVEVARREVREEGMGLDEPAEIFHQNLLASSVMSMPTGHQLMQRPQPTQPLCPNWSHQPASLCVSQ